MQSILLIEDDRSLADLLRRVLEKAGYTVTVALNGAQVGALPSDLLPDLIICDVMLPDCNGFELNAALRQRFECPLIYLTALDSDSNQIKGFSAGASDYIIKPVKPEILLARVNANIRKAAALNPQIKQLQHLRLDTGRQEAYFQQTNLEVNADEFRILEMLLEADPFPLTRDDLFLDIIGREYDGIDRAIDLKVSRLRKKLARRCQYIDIKSIRGQGYGLALCLMPQRDEQ